ncbi:tyrosine-protein phosphatase [Gulosibacter sp. 10]|uniref:tyrosine-protein phosphatase n=1 Tax=Gulosibacter sp. 10 TaxID=1255570 RepID=UPI00097EA635|nr:tyrosine-protein phosphatase [Gulosibacter sp. 10]SJM54457.1 protein tyrosine/serine phosphatase [Gulosibacter sp. 10]
MEHTGRDPRERCWEGAFNARDLGGVPVAGGRIRAGALFRSGQPEAWTPEGFRQASDDGVRRIFDLRDPEEPGGAPAGAERAGIDYRFVPVEDPRLPEFRARFVPYMNHTSGYRDFLAMFPGRVAHALREVFLGGPGTLVCCSAGRDRTGITTSMVLLSQGVELEALLHEDELAVRAVNERHRTRETPHPYESWQPEEALRPAIDSRREALAAFARGLDVRGFLRAHGLDGAADGAREWLVRTDAGR